MVVIKVYIFRINRSWSILGSVLLVKNLYFIVACVSPCLREYIQRKVITIISRCRIEHLYSPFFYITAKQNYRMIRTAFIWEDTGEYVIVHNSNNNTVFTYYIHRFFQRTVASAFYDKAFFLQQSPYIIKRCSFFSQPTVIYCNVCKFRLFRRNGE